MTCFCSRICLTATPVMVKNILGLGPKKLNLDEIPVIPEKSCFHLASISSRNDWVRKPARKIDVNSEMDLCRKFDEIARGVRVSYKFAGISSNNIFWTLTPVPVRIMTIPLPAENRTGYITVVNPEVMERGSLPIKISSHAVPYRTTAVTWSPEGRMSGWADTH